MEKNIKDQLISSEVMVARSSFKVLLEDEKYFCQLGLLSEKK
ncbi:MAG: hypothetical protein ACOX79_12910 [Methanosarcina sp.]